MAATSKQDVNGEALTKIVEIKIGPDQDAGAAAAASAYGRT